MKGTKDDIEINLPKIDIKFDASLIIILLSTLLGIYLIAPLFSPGIPMNIDSLPHYYRIFCLSENGLAPNNWCPYINAGLPTSQYYYPIADQLIVFLGKIISLELAYKFFMLLGFFAVPFGAYFLLKELGFKLSGAMAYAFLLIQPSSWHAGGLQETVLVGFWHYMLTIGAWFIGIALFIRLINEPNKKNLFFSVLITLFLTHPMTMVIAFFSYVIVGLYYYKKLVSHWKWVLAFVISAFGINVYYLVPLFLKLKYFNIGLLERDTGVIPLLYSYIYQPLPKIFFLLFLVGLTLCLAKKKFALPVVFFSILINFLFVFFPYLNRFSMGIRWGAFFVPFVFIFSAVFIEGLSKATISLEKHKVPIKIAAIVIFIILAGILFSQSVRYRESIMTSGDDSFAPYINTFNSFSSLQPGRILVEDTLFSFGNSPVSFTHIQNMIPILTKKELITFAVTYWFPKNYNLPDISMGSLFGKQVADYKEEELNELLNLFNIRYVLVHSKPYFDAFKVLSKNAVQFDQFILMETNITPSFFSVSKGSTSNEVYEGLKGSVSVNTNEKTDVTMKVNYYPNWAVYVDDKKAETKDCLGFVCAEVDKSSSVEFKYESLWYEYVSYLVSIITLIILILLLMGIGSK